MRNGVIAGLIGLAAFLGIACSTSVGTSGIYSVPKDASATCAQVCSDVGMSLGQLVVMANEVGCVCDAAKSRASMDNGAAAGSAGAMAAVLEQREAASRQAAQARAH